MADNVWYERRWQHRTKIFLLLKQQFFKRSTVFITRYFLQKVICVRYMHQTNRTGKFTCLFFIFTLLKWSYCYTQNKIIARTKKGNWVHIKCVKKEDKTEKCLKCSQPIHNLTECIEATLGSISGYRHKKCYATKQKSSDDISLDGLISPSKRNRINEEITASVNSNA